MVGEGVNIAAREAKIEAYRPAVRRRRAGNGEWKVGLRRACVRRADDVPRRSVIVFHERLRRTGFGVVAGQPTVRS